MDDDVLLQCRTLLTIKAPVNIQRVDELVTKSRHQDSTGHVRDVLLCTAHMYSFDLIEDDYMWSMDWSRAWSPDDLTVIPAYIVNAYTLNSSNVTLNHLNARDIMRWWNLKRAVRAGPSWWGSEGRGSFIKPYC